MVSRRTWPPAWAFFIHVFSFSLTLSLMILLYTFSTLLASVIPLLLEHFPFMPFPLYSLIISPFSHAPGISSVMCAFSIIVSRFSLFLGLLLRRFHRVFGLVLECFPFFLFFMTVLNSLVFIWLLSFSGYWVLGPIGLFPLFVWSIQHILQFIL